MGLDAEFALTEKGCTVVSQMWGQGFGPAAELPLGVLDASSGERPPLANRGSGQAPEQELV